MALNFSGLGFNVGAKDKASPIFDKIRSSAEGAGTAIRGIGDASIAKMFDAVIYPMLLKGAGILHRAEKDYEGFGSTLGESLGTIGLLGGAFEALSVEADAAAGPLDNLVPDSSIAEMLSLDYAVNDLSKSLGTRLPSSARKGTEKFRRSSDNIVNQQRNIAHGFDLMQEGISKLDHLISINKLGNFIAALNLNKLHQVADGIATIGNDNGRLTTGFEDMAQQASVSSRKIAAGYGFTGKTLDKVTAQAASMSMYMGISEQTTGASLYAMQLSAKELKAVGVDSAATMAKVADGLGIDAVEVGKVLGNMRQEFKFTDKDLKGVTGAFATFGQASGDVKGGIEGMNELLPVLRKRMLNMKQGDIPVEQFARDTAAAGAAIFAMTKDSKKAKDISLALATTLTDSREQFNNLFADGADDLHQFVYSVGISTGDVGQAFKAMAGGPGDFIKQMGSMVDRVKKSGKPVDQFLNLMRTQLGKAMDPHTVDVLMDSFKNFDGSVSKSMDEVRDAKKDLGAMGKEAWRTSITLQKSFELMEGAAMARFRSIRRETAETFVTSTGKAWASFNAGAEKLSAKGGPLGQIVDKMSELNQLGTKALLPQTLQPLVAVFGHLWSEIIPTVTALGALGFKIEGLLGPVGLLVGLSAALYVGMKQSVRNVAMQDKGFQQSQKTLKGYQKELSKTKQGTAAYDKALAKVTAQQKISNDIEAGFTQDGQVAFRKMLQDKLHTFVEKGKQIAAAVPDIVRTIGQGFLELKNAIPWKEIWNQVKAAAPRLGATLARMVRTAFDYVEKTIVDYVKDWWAHLGSIWSDKSGSFSDKIRETAESSVGIFLAAFAYAKFSPTFKFLFSILSKILGPLTSFVSGLVEVGAGLFGVETGVFLAGAAIVGLIAAFAIWPDKAHEYLDKALKYIHDFVSEGAEWLTTKFIGLVTDGWGDLPSAAGEVALRIWNAIVDVADLVPKLLDSIFDGIVDGIANAFKKAFPAATKEIDEFAASAKDIGHEVIQIWWYITEPIAAVIDLVDYLGKAFASNAGSSTGALMPMLDVLKTVWDVTKKVVGTVIEMLMPSLKVLGSIAMLIFTLMWGAIKIVWQILETVGYVIYRVLVLGFKILWAIAKPIIEGLTDYFVAMWQEVKPLADFIGTVLAGAFDILRKGASIAIDWVIDQFKALRSYIQFVFDWLEGVVDKAFGHSWFTDAFNTAFTAINGFIDNFFGHLSDIFDKIKGIVTTVFAPITTVVNKIFGGGSQSVPDLIAGGMDKAKSIMQDAMTAVQGMVEKGFTEAITSGITHAFVQAFKVTMAGTEKYIETQLKNFQRLTLGIYAEFNKMWVAILEDTEKASKAMAEEIGGALGDLSRLQSAFAAVGMAQQSAKTQASTGTDHSVQLQNASDQDEYRQKMLDLTNWPGWYTDYKAVFQAGISQLAAAMAQSSGPVRGQTGAAGAGAATLAARGRTAVTGGIIPPGGRVTPGNQG